MCSIKLYSFTPLLCLVLNIIPEKLSLPSLNFLEFHWRCTLVYSEIFSFVGPRLLTCQVLPHRARFQRFDSASLLLQTCQGLLL